MQIVLARSEQHIQSVPRVILKSGLEIPLLGFRIFQMQDLDECERSAFDPLAAGYELIDTVESYGSEAAVGNAIRKNGVPSDELFVTTNLRISDT